MIVPSNHPSIPFLYLLILVRLMNTVWLGGWKHFPARTGANQPNTNTANLKLTYYLAHITGCAQKPHWVKTHWVDLISTAVVLPISPPLANAFNQPLKSLHYNPGYPHLQSICSVVCMCAASSCCTVFKSLQGQYRRACYVKSSVLYSLLLSLLAQHDRTNCFIPTLPPRQTPIDAVHAAAALNVLLQSNPASYAGFRWSTKPCIPSRLHNFPWALPWQCCGGIATCTG